jgi:hypothetical protein
MSDLSPGARDLFQAARRGDLPTDADRVRIKRSVLLRAAAASAGAAAAAVSSSAAAWTAAKLGVLGVVAIAATSGGALWWRSAHPTAVPVRGATVPDSAPANLSPSPREPTWHAVSTDSQLGSAPLAGPSSSAGVHRRIGSTEPTGGPRTSLEAEVALLREAQDALRRDDPRGARAVLDEHARRFPNGALAEECRAVRAIIDCQTKPGPRASAQAEAFVRRAPASPLGDRVRQACGLAPSR